MSQPFDRTRPTSPADKLEYAIHLARAGRKLEAREVLRRLVALQPVNQAAWLWLSALATSRAEAEAALAQARKINPAHPSLVRAEQWLANRFASEPPTQMTQAVVSSSPPPAKTFLDFSNRLAFGLLILGILIGSAVLLLGLGWQMTVAAQTERNSKNLPPQNNYLETYQPALDAARTRQDWSQVIAILETIHQAQPDTLAVADQLWQAYLQKGIALRHKGFIEEALPFFEKALGIEPDQAQARQELELASTYLSGIQDYQAGHWSAGIAALEKVWAEDRDYLYTKDLLYSAYYNHGLALRAAGSLAEARTAFEAAIALRPDLSEPRLQMAEIEFALAPQTPLAKPLVGPLAQDQLILVGIVEQRMVVYEKDELVFDFVVSTGEPGRDTAIGEFEILDKIDVAYASTWNLDMPYWMGIYWSGPLQNGIHALPIVKHTGYKLWDGYLGQRVSYGCVILSDEDAATLYDWVEIGAKVKIVPSLAGWLEQQ